MSFDLTDHFWSEVAGSHEAQRRTAALVHAKVQAATWWPFLSHAANEQDFENRLSLVSNKIEAAVGPESYDEVLNSFRDDFRAVHEASRLEAGSTSPELAEFNTGLHSRQADLDAEFFNVATGKWEHVAEKNVWGDDKDEIDGEEYCKECEHAIPGHYTNCPLHRDNAKKQAGSLKDMTFHESYGPVSQELYSPGWGWQRDASQRQATNYQPDPNRAWRYYPGYENIEGANQVNNGALQDSDGFPIDLAQGEDERAQQRMQFQLTPGTWTEHDGMPERPMPFSQERGYRPVNASRSPNSHHYDAGYGHGARDALYGSDMDLDGARTTALEKNLNPDHYTYGYFSGHREVNGYPAASRPSYYAAHHEANKYIKQQGDKWVITQKGTGKVLSHHDSEEEAEASFRAMMQSKHGGSRRLIVDGDGFLVEASDVSQEGVAGRANSPLVDPAPGASQRVNPFYFNDSSAMGANEGFPVTPSADPQDRINELYGDTAPAASVQDISNSVDGKGYSRANSGESPDFNAGGKTASTDGKIVDHCPGCDQPRRVHSTPHGDEIRHLHNDHVRCHGARKTADLPPDVNPSPQPSASPDEGVTPGTSMPVGQDDIDPNLLPSTSALLPQFFDPTLSNGNVHTADYLGRPDAQNPTGRGADEYEARNWDAYQRTRPMQTPEDRNVNTPVLGKEPLHTPQVNTPTPGLKESPGEQGDDEAENEDED